MSFAVGKRMAFTYVGNVPVQPDFHVIRNPSHGFNADGKLAGKKIHLLLRKNPFIVIPPPGPRVPKKDSITIGRTTILDEEWIGGNDHSIEFDITSSCPVLVIGTLGKPSEMEYAFAGEQQRRNGTAAGACEDSCDIEIEEDYSDFASRLGYQDDALHRYYQLFWWHLRYGQASGKDSEPVRGKPHKMILSGSAEEIRKLVAFGIRP